MIYTFPRLVKIRPNKNLAFGALGRTFAGHLNGILIERLETADGAGLRGR